MSARVAVSVGTIDRMFGSKELLLRYVDDRAVIREEKQTTAARDPARFAGGSTRD